MENNQIHPLHTTDKFIIDSLITKESPDDFDLINLARLIKRYENFPGENEIKEDMVKILKFWKIKKDNLFPLTRDLWSNNFRPPNTSKEIVGSGFDTSE